MLEPSNAFATTTGLTQSATIGFPTFTRLTNSNFTSGNMVLAGPSKAQLVKFLALPNPPGITKASMSAGLMASIGVICPRAMRAASTSMFLDSFITSPVR